MTMIHSTTSSIKSLLFIYILIVKLYEKKEGL